MVAGLPPRPASTGSLGSWAGDLCVYVCARARACICVWGWGVWAPAAWRSREAFPGLPLGVRPSSRSARRLAPRQRRGPGAAAHAPRMARAAPRPPLTPGPGPAGLRELQLPGREEHDEVRGALDPVREHVGRVQVLGVRVLLGFAVRRHLLGPGALTRA